jgi:hypothetical protein
MDRNVNGADVNQSKAGVIRCGLLPGFSLGLDSLFQ